MKSLQEHQHKNNAKKAGNDDVDSPCTEGPLPICWVLSVKRHIINRHEDQGDLETCMIGLIDSTSSDRMHSKSLKLLPSLPPDAIATIL